MNNRASDAFARHIGDVAAILLGEPNRERSGPKEHRYGTHGSLSIRLDRGTWFDHEAREGGGVLKLIERETGRGGVSAIEWLRENGFPVEDAPRPRLSWDERIAASYAYRDETGAHLFDVVRLHSPKDFRQRAPDGTWKTKGIPRVVYRLPELLAADPDALVFFVEGEKDADRLASIGLVATTSPGGAGQWRDHYADSLKGRCVVVIPDNDQAGRDHAAAVLASCRKRGIRAAVLTLTELPEKGDVSDWLDTMGSSDELEWLASQALAERPDDGPEEERPADAEGASEATTARRATPFRLRPGWEIEPRRWLYDRRLIGGYVALTVSPGGLGKSTLVICEALAMVSGKPLLGRRPARPLRVWLFNGEDDKAELERRVTACAEHYDVTAEDIGERLFVDSGRDGPLVLAGQARDGVVLHRDRADALVAELRAREIDVFVADPFVTTHAVPENDNTAINAVVGLWREIADRAGCAVEIVHHAQKAAMLHGADLGMAQSRGASALIDGVRSARFLVPMSEDEATKAGLAGPAGFFRVVQGKANLAPRSDEAVWLHMASRALGNGAGLYPDGDLVGVPELWEKPDAFDGVTLADLAAVQAGIADGEARESEQSAAWVGRAVGDVLGLDVGPAKGRTREQTAARARVKAILAQWIGSGALRRETRHSARDGRDVPFVVVGEPAHAAA